MNFGEDAGALGEGGEVVEDELARLVVEGGLGVGVDEEAADDGEDVADAQVRLPVLLQRIHTDLPTRRRHIGMEHLQSSTHMDRDFGGNGKWGTLVRKKPLGGEEGKSLERLILIRN